MVMRSWTVRTVAKTETRTVRRKSLNRINPKYRQEPLKLTFPLYLDVENAKCLW